VKSEFSHAHVSANWLDGLYRVRRELLDKKLPNADLGSME